MGSNWIPGVIVYIIIVVAVVIMIRFLVNNPFIAGLLIGLVVGTGGTLIGVRVQNWISRHRLLKAKPQPK